LSFNFELNADKHIKQYYEYIYLVMCILVHKGTEQIKPTRNYAKCKNKPVRIF